MTVHRHCAGFPNKDILHRQFHICHHLLEELSLEKSNMPKAHTV